jgi:hypothetical protein
MEDKAKGRMKEAAGAFTGDEEKKAEGRAQQRKGAGGRGGLSEGQDEADREGGQRRREGARPAEAQGQVTAGRPWRHPLGTLDDPAREASDYGE